MKFVSTRNSDEKIMASEALKRGMAPDKGLYVPINIPIIRFKSLPDSFSDLSYEVIRPFFKDDILETKLKDICKKAFNFDLPLINLEHEVDILELFHGPTAAFKDFGARFLAECLSQLQTIEQKEVTILVATSGDTGGAVASAFFKRPFTQVFVLFPEGRVSKRQEKQLTCWGENIHSFAVKGAFDDCQDLVKAAFINSKFNQNFLLSSANSINLGRLLPQMAYYHYATKNYLKKWNKKPIIIIPSGNLGNALGAVWAMEMGAPIKKIILAVNENKTIPEYLDSGEWKPKASVQTLANAMDVGNPSNMERLTHYFPNLNDLKNKISSYSVSDNEIRSTIKETYLKYNQIICPHTAVAENIRNRYFKNNPVMIVATAHPSKFETVIQPLLNVDIPIPKQLADVLCRKSHFEIIENNLDVFYKACFNSSTQKK